MPARDGASYLKGLRATDREIWMGGERIDDVVEHPLLRGGADAIAAYYDLQIEHADVHLVGDDESGEPISITHVAPQSAEGLHRRGEALRDISELSMGVMGRTPDYMNVTFAGFVSDKVRWAGQNDCNEGGYENLVAFQKRLRRDDLSLTHTIVHPSVDKESDNQFVDNPVPLHKVGETANSIIVRGARLLSTLAPYADEQTVYPGARLPEGAPSNYALSFAIPMDAPGMVFLCRDSAIRPNSDPVDAPFSSRFDEQDAFCIFDDVEVPKEKVFIDGQVAVYNSVMAGGSWWPNVMQQTTIRAITKLEFAYGLAVRMAEMLNDRSPRTTEHLGEILGYVEMARSTLYAAEARCQTWEGGAVYLEGRALHPLRSLIPDWFVRINEIIKTLGSHNLIQVSSQAQLSDPRIRGLVDEFMPGANGATAEDRSNLFRAAWDFTGSELGGRGELYERNYLSSARTNRMLSQRLHSSATQERGKELVRKLIDDARRRRPA